MSIKGSWKRPDQTSQEEQDLRWEYAKAKIKMHINNFRKRVAEIRERTGKP